LERNERGLTEILAVHLPEVTEEYHENRKAVVSAEIRTKRPPEKSQERNRYAKPLSLSIATCRKMCTLYYLHSFDESGFNMRLQLYLAVDPMEVSSNMVC
jgi:hypothetical protein